MALEILDSSVVAAVAAATTQDAQAAALVAPWAGGNVTARVLAGDTLLATLTQGPWVQDNGADPRDLTLGARLARTFVAGGTPTRVVFRHGSTDIFSLSAGIGSGDVSFAAAISADSIERIAGLVVTAAASLPKVTYATAFTIALAASSGATNSPVSGTVTPTGGPLSAAATVTLSCGTGTFADATLDFASGATAAQAFSFTPTSDTTHSVSMTNTLGLLNTGSPRSYTSSTTGPTSLAISGASSGTTGAAVTLTFTLNAAATVAVTVTPTPVAGVTYSTPAVIAIGQTSTTCTMTRAADGSHSVAATTSPSLTVTGGYTFTSSALSSSGDLPANTITAGSTASTAVTYGQPFKEGALSPADGLSGRQTNILTLWPDGSVKHALVTRLVSGSTSYSDTLTIGTAASGTTLAIADLKAALSQPVAFDGGAFGTASFSGTDWDTPHTVVATGPLMSSWVHRKAFSGDSHLVAWVETRIFSTGAVEVLPWVENGYLTVATPTNKSATYTLTMGGTSRFSTAIDLPHHCRTPLVSGAALSHWLGTDPGVAPQHDRAYLQATELVPTYYATIDPSSSLVTGLPSTYTPLQQGSYDYQSDIMQNTGYASPIGLIPQHDALYLMASSGVWASLQRNAYSAGRYPIHWRDETTNRPPIFASYPNLVIGSGQGVTNTGGSSTSSYTPAVSGTSPPSWDLAHCPSVGYMAYLITGRFFHMETAQFAAVANHLHQDDVIRDGGAGVVRSYGGANDTRHAAWGIRTLWQAHAVTPDSDTTQKANFKAALQATIDFHHARYVAQSHNPLGFIEPGADYFGSQSSTYGDRLWMQDFSVASWGFLKSSQPTLDAGYAAKITAFFAWHAPATVGRLGDPDDANAWPVNNPAHYNGAVAASDTPDWTTGTGPWYSTFRAAYNATILTPPGWLSTNNLLLGAEILPGANSYLGNILPAIAYAVRHGVTGAQAALRRFMALEGFGRLILDLQTTPVWGVKPASGALPSWLTASTFAWNEIPTSTMAGSAAGSGSTPGDAAALTTRLLAYSSFAKRSTEVWTIATGGHNDSADNGVRKLDIGVDSPAWSLVKASDHNGSENGVAYYSSGSPASRHAHRSTQWVPQRSRFLLLGCRATYGGAAVSFLDVASFNPATGGYDASGTRAAPLCAINMFDPVTGIGLGSYTASGGQIVRFDAGADTHTVTAGGSIGYMPTGAYDSKRAQFYYLGWGDGEAGGTGTISRKVSSNGVTVTNITLTGSGAAAFTSAAPSYGSMVYDPVVDCFWWWDGISRQLFKIVPDGTTSWACTVQTISGTAPVVAQYSFSRMEYINELGGLAFMPTGAHPMQFVRTF